MAQSKSQVLAQSPIGGLAMRPIRVTGGNGRIHAPSGRQGAVASDVPDLAFSSFLTGCTGTTQAGEPPTASSPATGPIPRVSTQTYQDRLTCGRICFPALVS